MRILAVDSGLEKTGFAILSEYKSLPKLLISGLIKTDKTKKIEVRLWEIYQRLSDVVKEHKPNLIVMEQLFFFKNQKTAIAVAQAQGVISLIAGQLKLPLHLLTPLQIKQTITGYGLADKKSVKKMIMITMKLNKLIKEDDEMDAIACGLSYYYLNK